MQVDKTSEMVLEKIDIEAFQKYLLANKWQVVDRNSLIEKWEYHNCSNNLNFIAEILLEDVEEVCIWKMDMLVVIAKAENRLVEDVYDSIYLGYQRRGASRKIESMGFAR